MPGKVPLFQKKDTLLLVRDSVAALLKLESVHLVQQAKIAGVPSAPFDFRVYVERAQAWQQWVIVDGEPPEDKRPIVCVRLHRSDHIRNMSAVDVQRTHGEIMIEVFGYGEDKNDPTSGHFLGDEQAALARDDAYQTVRNVIMSGHYYNLGVTGAGIDRFIEDTQFGHPTQGGRMVQNVALALIKLGVDFDETSPQYRGEIISEVVGTVTAGKDGEVLLTMQENVPTE